MFNGVGLATSRGTGTNGFLQKNSAASSLTSSSTSSSSSSAKRGKDQRGEEEGGGGKQPMTVMMTMGRAPHADLASHDRKRKVELKCMEMQALMEEQGHPTEMIESKVGIFRRMLMQKEGVSEAGTEKEDPARPTAKEGGLVGEGQQEKSQRLKESTEGSTGDSAHPGGDGQDTSAAGTSKRQGPGQGPTTEEDGEEEQQVKRKKKKSRKHYKEEKKSGESSSPERGEKRRKHKKHRHSRTR